MIDKSFCTRIRKFAASQSHEEIIHVQAIGFEKFSGFPDACLGKSFSPDPERFRLMHPPLTIPTGSRDSISGYVSRSKQPFLMPP
jgi:hypothetical protein